jgi:hypothetical protein
LHSAVFPPVRDVPEYFPTLLTIIDGVPSYDGAYGSSSTLLLARNIL